MIASEEFLALNAMNQIKNCIFCGELPFEYFMICKNGNVLPMLAKYQIKL